MSRFQKTYFNPSTPIRSLGWIGLLFAMMYGIIFSFYQFTDLHQVKLYDELIQWFLVGASIFLYWQGALIAWKNPDEKLLPWVLGFGILFGLICFGVTPFHSTDVYGYINRGWQQAGYGVNPYVHPVGDIPGWESDPMFTDHWVNNPSPYGFLFILIAKGICLLGGGHFSATLLLFKGLSLVSHFLIAFLVWSGSRHIEQKNPGLSLYLYLWSPLILLHQIANGHNDIVMALFITLALWATLTRRWIWILPSLVAATLIKYAALVVIPFAIVFLAKNKAWKALITGLLLSASVFILASISYLPDWNQFSLGAIGKNAQVVHGSLHAFFYHLYKTLMKNVFMLPVNEEAVKSIIKYILLAGFGGICGWLGIQSLKSKDFNTGTFVYVSLLVVFLLVCFASLKFYPWYIAMFFPVAFLLPERHWLRRIVILTSVFQLFGFTFIGQAHMLNYLVMSGLPIGWVLWDEWQQATDNHPPQSFLSYMNRLFQWNT